MFPDLSPLDPAQREMLQKGLSSLRPEQLVWLSGYLSGRASGFLPADGQGILPTGAPSAEALAAGSAFSGAGQLAAAAGIPGVGMAPAAAAPPVQLLVLYGTESGNSETLADRLFKTAKKSGAKPTLKNMSEISPADLKKYDNIFTLVSTWGDGEPPESADSFYKAFMSEDVDLKGKNFSVLALGDTSYEKFCQTGKDMDERFVALGATRIVDREDCDVDFEDNYDDWSAAVLAKIEELKPAAAAVSAPAPAAYGAPTGDAGFAYGVAPAAVESAFDKSNPFPAEVIANVNLNGTGSAKETIHLELSLEGSGLQYEVGDALAVIPQNADDVVEAFLKASGLDADAKVELKKTGEVTFRKALRDHLDITALSRKVVQAYQEITSSPVLADLLSAERKQEFKSFLWGREIIDLFEIEPFKGSPQEFVNILRKLPPRLYSIASSLKAHPDEVHLTVAAVRYNAYGRERKGVASTYMADDAKVGDKVNVYIHKNKNFRLPADAGTPIIMVGPGTGVAPFRAFVEERAETGAEGESWLIFGDQRYSYDFLYQLEWQDHLKNGDLTKLDVAFSRDQPNKVYVQHRMLEKGAEMWDWIENKGASFYVCGDAERMAGDVHDALIKIAQEHGKMSSEEAAEYFDDLKKDKRYQRDVY